MPNAIESNDNVIIHAADHSLHAKIGNINLDLVITPEIIKSAQETIDKSADQFAIESMGALEKLEEAIQKLEKMPQDITPPLATITQSAFAIKTKAGISGHGLVSTLAKSLQYHCEQMNRKLAPKSMAIIRWHANSIRQLLVNRVKGTGGPAGEAIIAELERLSSAPLV